MKKRRFYKPYLNLPPYGSYALIELFKSGQINLRQVYRAYLLQCKDYSFMPSEFRVQYKHLIKLVK